MELPIDLFDLFVGRTLGRITPNHENKTIEVAFVDREKYELYATEDTHFTDLFINTMHKAQQITYLRYHEVPDYSGRWMMEFGNNHHIMAQLWFEPGDPRRPFISIQYKKVSR